MEEERSGLDNKKEERKENRVFLYDCFNDVTSSCPPEETCKFKPKLRSVGLSFLSCGQSASVHGESDTKDSTAEHLEAKEQNIANPDHVIRMDVKGEMTDGTAQLTERREVKECVLERGEEEDGEKGRRDRQEDMLYARADNKDGWRWSNRERLVGSVEEDEKEVEKPQVESKGNKRSSQRHRASIESAIMGDEQMTDSATEGPVDHRLERRASVRRTIFSHVLMHSSASSTSSSFNCSSAESDDVFSETEETMSKVQDGGNRKKTRSWRTYLTVMQWSKRRQSSWVQLAGHAGNFCPSEGGEVLKKYNAVENACLQALMRDSLRPFVPQYYGLASRGNETYIRLEDLLSGHTCPIVMDCKMGVRTYLEEELNKVRQNPSLRSDMYQKMVKVDPSAPLVEEHSVKAITKSRYMQWRDTMSSTSSLGFRIEGITMENGRVLRDFKMTRTLAQVTDTLLTFTKRQSHILKAYLSRLMALHEALKDSDFFKTHEIIGSSLLFIHDHTSKANVWMIDFGKTFPTPSGVHLNHNIPWAEGNREDGYLIGLTTLTSIVEQALEQAQKQDLCNFSTDSNHTQTTRVGAEGREAMQKEHQTLLLERSTPMDTGLEDVLSGSCLESSMSELQSDLNYQTVQTAVECISTQPLHHNIIPELNFSNSLSSHKFSLSGKVDIE